MNFDFDAFTREWIGRRVADDSLVRNGEETDSTKYQCVSFVKQYLRERYHLEPGSWGNAINYWNATNPALYAFFDRVPTQDPEKGDIVILNSTATNAAGHIGISTGNKNSTQAEIVEQNGATGGGTGLNNDAIRTRYITKSRIAGVLRPKPETSPFNPDSYKTLYATPRQVILNKSVNKWDIGYPDFTGIAAHPVDHKDQGYTFTVVAYMNHPCGETYLLESMSDVGGWNAKDCNNYVPAPYVPPGAPMKPVMAETYQLVTTVRYYETYDDALRDQDAKGTKSKGTYFLRTKRGSIYELADFNMATTTVWINTKENEPEAPTPSKIVETVKAAAELIPEPTLAIAQKIDDGTWRVTKSLRPDGKPIYYRFTNTQPIEIYDLEDKQPPIKVAPYNNHVSGAFVQEFWKENDKGELIHYLRPQKVAKNFWFYGVPVGYLEPVEVEEFDYNHDGKRDLSDVTALGQGFIEDISSVVHKLGAWDKTVHISAKTKQFTKGMIDGIIRRKAK